MGRTLALLHVAMARFPQQSLPPVAAINTTAVDADQCDWQLLHGDFNDQNMIWSPTGLRIFDFDECGYGPMEFDVAIAAPAMMR